MHTYYGIFNRDGTHEITDKEQDWDKNPYIAFLITVTCNSKEEAEKIIRKKLKDRIYLLGK